MEIIARILSDRRSLREEDGRRGSGIALSEDAIRMTLLNSRKGVKKCGRAARSLIGISWLVGGPCGDTL
jgi:Kef-type K+ transport system membrane component KefB